ncbi:hypothetical protein F5Y12DRAFT_793312 [Xylaria sp. FL1777]|nr:hypothetical protein F5Y12DRAFT_793312 [Xylaria sp. FL1777]
MFLRRFTHQLVSGCIVRSQHSAPIPLFAENLDPHRSLLSAILTPYYVTECVTGCVRDFRVLWDIRCWDVFGNEQSKPSLATASIHHGNSFEAANGALLEAGRKPVALHHHTANHALASDEAHTARNGAALDVNIVAKHWGATSLYVACHYSSYWHALTSIPVRITRPTLQVAVTIQAALFAGYVLNALLKQALYRVIGQETLLTKQGAL